MTDVWRRRRRAPPWSCSRRRDHPPIAMVVAWMEITESADWEALFTDEQVQVVGDGPKQPVYRAPAVLQSHPRHLIPARIQAFARERPGTPGSVSSGSENQGIKGGGLIQTSHTNSRFVSDFCHLLIKHDSICEFPFWRVIAQAITFRACAHALIIYFVATC
jgi:hypothetical protein